MRFYRAARTRVIGSGLALVALVLQTLVVGQHSAAMAASEAASKGPLAELASLGLSIGDVPCYSRAIKGPGKDTSGAPKDSGAWPCPMCALHSSPLAAVLPGPPAIVVPVWFRGDDLPLPSYRIVGTKHRHGTQARAPPLGA